ncbi:MAG: alpha-2-macroglobulin, partial [Myxococcota bacterium]
LGKEGAGSIACPTLDHAGGFTGAAKLVADVAVFEAGSGRTTNATATIPVHAAKYYVGIRAAVDKIEAGKPVLVEGVVVDWNGELVTDVDSVSLELQKLESEWGYVYDDATGQERWQRILRASPAGTETVKVSKGTFKVNLQPQSDGEQFRIVARTADTKTSIEVQGTERYWWWGDGEQSKDATPRPLKPSDVALTTPEKIEVGDSTSVSFVAPFKGRALVTLETDQVLRSEWMPVDAGPQDWSFTLGEFAENVYVSVLVVKDPHLESKDAFLPERAFGVKSIDVNPTAFVGKLDIKVPEEVRSDSTLDVAVDLGPGKGPRYVTVAAVDEGILSLTDFQTPDPTDALFPTRALGVRTWETVGWSLHLQPPGPSSSTGGDADGGGPGRVQMVKPVSLWSGVVEVPESGKTTVSFDVPRYRGKLRVMAVSAGTKQVAHADAEVVVRDPVVLQTTLPRFLTQGDQAEIPVFLTNVSGKKRTVSLQLDAKAIETWGANPLKSGEEPLSFTGGKTTTVVLEDGESHTAVFRVRTNLAAGGINLSVVAKSEDVIVSESLDVPIEASGPRERRTQTIELTSSSLDLNPLLSGWVAGSEQTNVWITSNPYGTAFSHLKHVIRYPYGCIEQTTSSTRPLLYVGNLLEASDPDLVKGGKIEDMVQSGVDRLMNMQTPSGGFAYWMGGTEPTAWGTAYATHLLLDAKDAGFAVPEDNLQDAVDWLDRTIAAQENDKDPYHHGSSPGGAAYMHYVLARAGKGQTKRMGQLLAHTKSRRDGASMEATYLLKAGLYLSGDRRYEKDLRNPDMSPLTQERKNDWTFYSDLRRRGFQLAVYADLFGDDGDNAHRQGQLVARGLEGKTSRYYNTQEIAWGMTGLGKIIQKGSRDYSVSLTRNGKETKPDTWGSGGKSTELTWSVWRASEAGDLDLKVDKKGAGKLFAVVNSEGVRSDAQWRFGGSGLSVSRTYMDQEGDPINLDAVELGDVVYAKVTLRNTSNDRIQNIALVDRFPASWEIENPRLGRGGSADWVEPDQLWKTDNMNLRDDRLEVFGGLNGGESKEVVYTLRAVTAGNFTLPPVEAEAMYNPEIWTRAPGGSVRVFGSWDGFYL